MARPELGIKRQCQNCSAKFYDLGRSPPVCPKCGTVQQPVVAAARTRAEPARAAEPAAPAAAADVELVSLEEADHGADGGVVAPAKLDDADDDDAADTSSDNDESADDDSFLEDDEEDDDNVAGLIDGDIEDDEEN